MKNLLVVSYDGTTVVCKPLSTLEGGKSTTYAADPFDPFVPHHFARVANNPNVTAFCRVRDAGPTYVDFEKEKEMPRAVFLLDDKGNPRSLSNIRKGDTLPVPKIADAATKDEAICQCQNRCNTCVGATLQKKDDKYAPIFMIYKITTGPGPFQIHIISEKNGRMTTVEEEYGIDGYKNVQCKETSTEFVSLEDAFPPSIREDEKNIELEDLSAWLIKHPVILPHVAAGLPRPAFNCSLKHAKHFVRSIILCMHSPERVFDHLRDVVIQVFPQRVVLSDAPVSLSSIQSNFIVDPKMDVNAVIRDIWDRHPHMQSLKKEGLLKRRAYLQKRQKHRFFLFQERCIDGVMETDAPEECISAPPSAGKTGMMMGIALHPSLDDEMRSVLILSDRKTIEMQTAACADAKLAGIAANKDELGFILERTHLDRYERFASRVRYCKTHGEPVSNELLDEYFGPGGDLARFMDARIVCATTQIVQRRFYPSAQEKEVSFPYFFFMKLFVDEADRTIQGPQCVQILDDALQSQVQIIYLSGTGILELAKSRHIDDRFIHSVDVKELPRVKSLEFHLFVFKTNEKTDDGRDIYDFESSNDWSHHPQIWSKFFRHVHQLLEKDRILLQTKGIQPRRRIVRIGSTIGRKNIQRDAFFEATDSLGIDHKRIFRAYGGKKGKQHRPMNDQDIVIDKRTLDRGYNDPSSSDGIISANIHDVDEMFQFLGRLLRWLENEDCSDEQLEEINTARVFLPGCLWKVLRKTLNAMCRQKYDQSFAEKFGDKVKIHGMDNDTSSNDDVPVRLFLDEEKLRDVLTDPEDLEEYFQNASQILRECLGIVPGQWRCPIYLGQNGKSMANCTDIHIGYDLNKNKPSVLFDVHRRKGSLIGAALHNATRYLWKKEEPHCWDRVSFGASNGTLVPFSSLIPQHLRELFRQPDMPLERIRFTCNEGQLPLNIYFVDAPPPPEIPLAPRPCKRKPVIENDEDDDNDDDDAERKRKKKKPDDGDDDYSHHGNSGSESESESESDSDAPTSDDEKNPVDHADMETEEEDDYDIDDDYDPNDPMAVRKRSDKIAMDARLHPVQKPIRKKRKHPSATGILLDDDPLEFIGKPDQDAVSPCVHMKAAKDGDSLLSMELETAINTGGSRFSFPLRSTVADYIATILQDKLGRVPQKHVEYELLEGYIPNSWHRWTTLSGMLSMNNLDMIAELENRGIVRRHMNGNGELAFQLMTADEKCLECGKFCSFTCRKKRQTGDDPRIPCTCEDKVDDKGNKRCTCESNNCMCESYRGLEKDVSAMPNPPKCFKGKSCGCPCCELYSRALNSIDQINTREQRLSNFLAFGKSRHMSTSDWCERTILVKEARQVGIVHAGQQQGLTPFQTVKRVFVDIGKDPAKYGLGPENDSGAKVWMKKERSRGGRWTCYYKRNGAYKAR